jgi:hypothetical protein
LRRISKILRNEQGATAAFVAVGLVAILGMVALAVDLGMMLGARTGSQHVAATPLLRGPPHGSLS